MGHPVSKGKSWGRIGGLGYGSRRYPLKRRKTRSDFSKPEEQDCLRDHRGAMLEEEEEEVENVFSVQ